MSERPVLTRHRSMLFSYSRWERLLMWFGLMRDPRRSIAQMQSDGNETIPAVWFEEFERRLHQQFLRGALFAA